MTFTFGGFEGTFLIAQYFIRSETKPKNLNYAAFPCVLLTLKGLDSAHDYAEHILRTESDHTFFQAV